jgi:O-antigen/teichoic acid export membrane protein
MSHPGARGSVRGMATLFRDYTSVLGARFASSLLSLCSVLITTRILDPAGYGVVAYVSAAALLVSAVTSSWTNAAVSRYGRQEFEEYGTTVAVTWARMQLVAPLLLIAAPILIFVKLGGGFPAEVSWPLTWLAIAYGVVLGTSDHVTYSLTAVGRIRTSALQLVSQQTLAIVILAGILISGGGASPAVIVSVTVASLALVTIVFASRVARVALWPPRRDADLRRRMLRFAGPLAAFTLSQYVIRYVDFFVIGAFATTTAVGIYAIAYQGYGVLQYFTTATGPVLTPLFVSLRMGGREDLLNRYVERLIPQLMLLAATLAGLAVPFVGIVIPVVFGESYAKASDPLAILLFASISQFGAALLSPVIFLHERTVPVGVVNILAVLVNVIGDIVLVGPAGMHLTGPAIATGAATATIMIGYVGIVRGCTDAHASVRPAMLAPFFAGLVPTLVLTHAAFVVAIVATAGCAAAVTLLAKPFEQEDVDLIARLDMPTPLKRLATRALELAAR